MRKYNIAFVTSIVVTPNPRYILFTKYWYLLTNPSIIFNKFTIINYKEKKIKSIFEGFL